MCKDAALLFRSLVITEPALKEIIDRGDYEIMDSVVRLLLMKIVSDNFGYLLETS